ncbi:beta-ketoacyl-ACP synthase II [soil metagenome]
MSRAVAITGIGVVAPCGIGIDAFWAGLHRPAPDGEAPRRCADFDPLDWFDTKGARRHDRFAQLAVAAAALAVDDAALEIDDPDRTGVSVATGIGGLPAYEAQYEINRERGADRVSPFLIPMLMPNAGAAAVSLRWGARGPCETITTACAAGTHAIGAGLGWIQAGRCDVVLAGGTEAAPTETGIAAFTNMTALSTRAVSQPFDTDRDGFVMGEGAGVLVLEHLDRARSRGARIYALLLSAASTADAHHVTAPDPTGSGAIRCMRLAIDEAGVGPDDIGHINAHGTSTPLNDAAEAQAISAVFGDRRPPVTSVKGVTGHLLGAAGAVEAAALALTIERASIPPTGGLRTPDPELPIDPVAGEARPWKPAPALSNSFGFGGHNGCLVLAPPT